MRLAILATNTDDSAFAACHPRDESRFAAMVRLVRPEWDLVAFDVVAGDLPAPDAFDGHIITGSTASANDPDGWIAGLKDFIRHAHSQRVPLFGACFGHQVIAAALGGRVEPAPGGWRLGAYEGPLGDFAGGGAIRLYASHADQVVALPRGAMILGGTEDCPVGAYRMDGHVFATQYHPEFPPDFMADLIEAFAHEIPEPVNARARASLAAGPAEMARFAEGVAQFFEAAQASAASRSIAVT